ncbi:MAG: RHS repeat domain-containing protein [Bacteroidota bacterium]
MMKRISIYTCLSLFFLFLVRALGQNLDSQIDPFYVNENMPSAPEVSSLGEFGKVTASPYNGKASIEVPIFSIPYEGMSIPVKLSYDTGGVKVSSEASWVGLNWDLSAAFGISRRIYGGDDFEDARTGSYENAPLNGFIYNSLPLQQVQGQVRPTHDLNDILNVHYSFGVNRGVRSGANSFDTQPDVFTARLFGKSYTFILQKKGADNIIQGTVFNSNNVKVSLNLDTMVFTLVDDEGYTYTFGTKDYSTTFSTSETASSYQTCIQFIFADTNRRDETLITNWSLDEVISPRGRLLQFEYSPGLYFNFPHYTFDIDGGDHNTHLSTNEGVGTINGSSQKNHNASTTIIENNYLTKITGDFGQMDFLLEDRLDLSTGNTLQRISNGSFGSHILVTSQSHVRSCHGNVNCVDSSPYLPKKLSGIEVTNSLGKKVVDAQMEQSYYNSDKAGETINERYLRLKLDGVNINEREYRFTYRNENALPPKDSYAVDFWGYYNGKGTNDTYVPRIKRFCTSKFLFNNTAHLGQTFREFLGSDRGSDHRFGFNGLLERVTYPTKGYTILEYEPHDIVLSVPPPFQVTETVNGTDRFKWTDMVDESRFDLTYQYLKNAKDAEYNYLESGLDFEQGDAITVPQGIGQVFSVEYPSVLEVNGNIETYTGHSGTSYWAGYPLLVVENIESGQELTLFTYADAPSSPGSQPSRVSTGINLPKGDYRVIRRSASSLGGPSLPPVPASSFSNGEILLHTFERLPMGTDLSDFLERFEVGGARIRKVVDRDADNAFIGSTEYDYTVPGALEGLGSSGKLMDDLVFHMDAAGFHSYNPGGYTSFSLVGHNVVGGNPSAQGCHIGYSQVREYKLDENGDSQGWIQREYHNEKNAYFRESFCRPFSYDSRTGSGDPYIEILGLFRTKWTCSGLDFGNDCTGTSRAYSSFGDACIENAIVLSVPLRLSFGYANGNVIRENVHDRDGNLVKRRENDYEYLNGNMPREHYSSFMGFPLGGRTDADGLITSSAYLTSEGPWGADHHTYYPYQFPLHYGLVSKLSATRTTKFLGDGEHTVRNSTIFNEGTHHPKFMVETVNGGETYCNRYFYPYDTEVGAKEAMGDLRAENRLATVVRSIRSKDDRELAVLDYGYGKSEATSDLTLATSIGRSKKLEELEGIVAFDKYDGLGNLLQSRIENGTVRSGVWAYNGQLRVINAENVSYAALEPAVSGALPTGHSSLDAFLESLDRIQTDVPQQRELELFNTGLRDALPSARITTYTYVPLVGMTSMTDPRGYTTYYEYDDFNRLKVVRDEDGKLITDYEYHYKGQEID